MATPMSEAPPRTRTDCTAPRASFIRDPPAMGSSRPGRRRARSEHSRRSGSTRSRTARQAGSAGYMASSNSGRSRASLARYTRPPAATIHLVQVIQELRQPAGAGRQVERQRPARPRERQGRRVCRPEALEHGQERGAPGRAQRPRACDARVGFGSVRNHHLVLDEAPAAIDPVPPGDAVQGMKEASRRHQVAQASRRGALRYQSSLKAATRPGVEQPRGRPGRGLGPVERAGSGAPRPGGADPAGDRQGGRGPRTPAPSGRASGPGPGSRSRRTL